jgi:hypothetical protein
MLLMRMTRRDRLALFMRLAQDASENGGQGWDLSWTAQAAFDGWTNERQVSVIMTIEETQAARAVTPQH